jgi:hypothetical protein
MRLSPLAAAAAALLAAAVPARALCGPGMADIEGKFCIDKYEASLIEARGSGSAPWSPYQTPLATATYRAVSVKGGVPQGYISGAQAAAACRNASKRLCEAAEWLQACRGPAGQTYPYGNGYTLQACNEHSRDPKYAGPLQRLHHGAPAYDRTTMNDPRINQLPDTVARSGAHEDCGSPYGVYDLVGNLHEWTAERNKANGVFRGGYFNEAELNGSGCGYKTTAHLFEYHDYSTGFRCCAEPISAPAFK